MNMLIRKAIEDLRLIRFSYKGPVRTVEPHAYGRQSSGAAAICAWQLSGGSGQEFRLFKEDEMESVQLLDENFHEARPGHRRGGSRFVLTHAEL